MSASSAAELIDRLGGLYVRLIIPKEADRNTIRSEAEAHDVGFREVEGEFYVRASAIHHLQNGRHEIGNWTAARQHRVRPDISKRHLFYDPSVRMLILKNIDTARTNNDNVHLTIKSHGLEKLEPSNSAWLHLTIQECTVDQLIHRDSPQTRFEKCEVRELEARTDIVTNSIKTADFLQIKSDCKRVESGRYYIIQIENLDQKPVFGRAVEIVYDEKILRKWYNRGLKPEQAWHGWRLFWHFNLTWGGDRAFDLTNSDFNRDLINTYVELLKNPSLQSHEIALQRYLAYFRSRNHWFTRLLFLINGGFYRIAVPAVLTVIFLGAILACIWCAGPEYFSQVGELILNPLKFWSHFVLHNADLSWPLSWPKIIAALLHPALLYLVFSAAVAIKRRFGFPKE